MGRSRKWEPRRVRIADDVAAAALMQKYGPDKALKSRLREDYNKFKALNPHLKSHVSVLNGIFGQMKVSDLEPGSICSYIRTMDQFAPFTMRAFDVVAAAEAFATDCGGRGHAADIDQ